MVMRRGGERNESDSVQSHGGAGRPIVKIYKVASVLPGLQAVKPALVSGMHSIVAFGWLQMRH